MYKDTVFLLYNPQTYCLFFEDYALRDIRIVLERFAAWCCCNAESVTWYRTTPGFGAMIPSRRTFRPSCCDSDALAISAQMAALSRSHPDMHNTLYDYYIMGQTLTQMAQQRAWSVAGASRRLQSAEEDLAELLCTVRLEMDKQIA